MKLILMDYLILPLKNKIFKQRIVSTELQINYLCLHFLYVPVLQEISGYPGVFPHKFQQ